MSGKVFRGTVFETPARNTLSIIADALIVIDTGGRIEAVLDPVKDKDVYIKTLAEATRNNTLHELKKGQYVLPGLVDLHVHAPQWPNLGMALDRSLAEWLQKVTFPLEAKYADVAFATRIYNSLVSALLANGTTCVAYFATVHVEGTVRLAEICLEKGQRAVVGRVAMDLPEQCPDFYRDASPEESIRLSEEFIRQVIALPGNEGALVRPAVIPRFIPTCSHEALAGLGALAKKYDCHVQTHCSESDWEHNHVLARYGKHDAFALDDFGLMTRKTVLAHSNFLSNEDMDLVRSRQAAVAHCPLSNVYFSNAVFPLRRALDNGLHVGMGTDISGGPSASLYEVCRGAVAASRILEDGADSSLPRSQRSKQAYDEARVNHIEAFFVASAMGGVALDLPIGRIAKGYYFDAVVVDTTVPHSNLHIFEGLDSLEDIFQKIVFNVAPVNITQTYVNGRLVHSI